MRSCKNFQKFPSFPRNQGLSADSPATPHDRVLAASCSCGYMKDQRFPYGARLRCSPCVASQWRSSPRLARAHAG